MNDTNLCMMLHAAAVILSLIPTWSCPCCLVMERQGRDYEAVQYVATV